MAGYLTQAWIEDLQAAARLATVPGDVRLVIQQVVTDGSPEGEVTYAVEVADGKVLVTSGHHPRPDVTFVQDRATAAAIASGAISAQTAFIEGRLRLEGDVRAVLEHASTLATVDDVFAPARAGTAW